jgi:hypothetical protein
VRLAATDDRLAALVMPAASICDKYYLMEEESPRYKQLFAYLTRAKSEDELDAFVAEMDLRPLLPQVGCSTLLGVGEYDPRSPLDEIYELYDSMQAPRELWVYEDQHHMAALRGMGSMGSTWLRDTHNTAFDWLRDRFDGKPLRDSGGVVSLEQSGSGPNGPDVRRARRWFD